MPEIETIAVIGVGRAGGAIVLGLTRAGEKVDAMIVRERRTADLIATLTSPAVDVIERNKCEFVGNDLVIIATRDDEIGATAEWLAARIGDQRPVVLHLSGAVSSEVLEPLRKLGCSVGSFHPLVSISSAVRGADSLSGIFYGLEGDRNAVEKGAELAACLGGRTLLLSAAHKPLYHAAAVNACGNLVALVDVSIEMLAVCGIDGENAREALLPLIASTLANLRSQRASAALTGPFARGDAATIDRHLEIISAELSTAVLSIYSELGLRSLGLAAENGGAESQIQPIRDKLLLAKTISRC